MLGACGLRERVTVVPPARATDVHLRAYHDRDYVEVEVLLGFLFFGGGVLELMLCLLRTGKWRTFPGAL